MTRRRKIVNAASLNVLARRFAIASIVLGVVSFVLAVATVAPAQTASPPCPAHWTTVVVRVVDADTIDLRIDLGWDVLTRQRIRLVGVDAPEIRGSERPAGLRATAWVRQRLAAARIITVGPPRGRVLRRGRYGRFIAEICLDGVSLSDSLLRAGHARRYR